MQTARRRLRPAGLLAALAVLGLAPACASPGRSQLERDQQLRRAQSHFDIGIDHLSNGRVALGLRELLSAHELDPLNPRIRYGLAGAYMRKARYAEAESHLREALAIHPAYHDARLSLSALLIELGRYEEAVREVQLLLDDPTFPAPWRALTNGGWAHFKLGENGPARRKLELAREYNERYWPALLNLGILASQEGRRLEAIELLRRIPELEPGASASAEAYYRLGEIYVSLGQRGRAVEHFRAAIAQAPSGRWGQRSEEYLKLLR